MTSEQTKNIKYTAIFLIAVNVVWAIAIRFTEQTSIYNYLFNLTYGLIYLYGGYLALKYSRDIQGVLGKALFYFGLGQLSYAAAQIIWFYYNVIAHTEIPYPGLADVFFLLFYPLVGFGVWQLLKIYGKLINKKAVIELGLILIAVSALVFFFLNSPDLSSELPLTERIFNFAYPFGDAIILSMALLTLRYGGGKLANSLNWIMIAIALLAAGDFIFSYQTAEEIYYNGALPDILFMLSAAALAWATIKIAEGFTPKIAEK